MTEDVQAMEEKIDVRYHCGMKYSIVLGAEVKFEEHPRCEGSGIIKGVDREHLERSRRSRLRKAESELTVMCQKCGMPLNWFSGHFEEIQTSGNN